MADPLSALVGGLITLALTAAVRAPGIPAAVRRHDAQVASRDASLETWVTDRNYALGRECVALRAEVVPDGNPDAASDWPGGKTMEIMARAKHRQTAQDADGAIADARGRALHEYRDEATRARDDVATILAAEGRAHRLYRRAARKPAPSLTAPDRVSPVLAAWRKPSGMSSERWTWPVDATQRTLEDTIRTMPVSGP